MQNFNKITKSLKVEAHLPHNFLAEKIVLSSMLINSEAIDIALRILPVESFYFLNHQEIYKAIKSMHKKKIPIDILTLNTFLQDQGLLEKVGGMRILLELINQIPNLVYLEEYINLLQDKFLRRSLIKIGYQAINSGYITNIPFENILYDFENQLFYLTNEIKKQKIISTAELLSQVFLELKQRSLNPTLSGLSSGFYDFDSFTQGLQNSDLIILAGRPSMGKTAFSLNLALNIIKNSNLPVLFFSLEMSKEQVIYRILSMETKINQMRLRRGNIYKEDWFQLTEIIRMLSTLPFFIDDTPNLSINKIRSKIKAILFEQNKIGMIIIDYLQLMQNTKFKTDNRVQEISQITRSLKSIAREFNIPVIALSQLSRGVENRVNKRPILSDLRESGSIEQDADLVCMLYRDNYYNSNKNEIIENSKVELIIAKQRNGPTGTVNLEFDESCTKFFDSKIST